MRWRGWVALAIAGLVGLVVVLAVHGAWQRRAGAWDAERAANLARNDTTARERDAARALVARAFRERDAALAAAASARARADREQARADRLARARAALPPLSPTATTTDSLRRAEAALALAQREIAAVRFALTAAEERGAQLEQAHAALQRAVDTLTAQVAREQANAQRLAAQLQDAQAPCRLLWFPCPSRTVVAVGSAVAGALAGAILARQHSPLPVPIP